jgi:hypothetical protein
MSIPCYSDAFQTKLLNSLEKYQEKTPSYNGFAKYNINGQIYDNGISIMNSSDIVSKMNTFNSVPIMQKDGFVLYDGTNMKGVTLNLTSSSGLQKLASNSNNWMQKSNSELSGITTTINDNILASKYSINDQSSSDVNILWSSKKISNMAIADVTLPLEDVPNLNLDTKQDKVTTFVPQQLLTCDFKPAGTTLDSSQIADKLKNPNVLLKLNSTLFPKFTKTGQLETSGNFPNTSFTNLYTPIELPKIDGTLYQDVNLVEPNKFIVFDSDKITGKDIVSSEEMNKMKMFGLSVKDAVQKPSFVNMFGNSVDESDLITADKLISDIKTQVCSGIFHKLESNMAIFDQIEGNIKVVDSKTLDLNGNFSLHVYLNTSTGPIYYKTVLRNNGLWNLFIQNTSTLLPSKFILYSL